MTDYPTTTQELRVRPAEVRRGDVIGGRTVESIESKTKYRYVTTCLEGTDPKRLRFDPENGDSVVVTRTVLTDEAQAQQRFDIAAASAVSSARKAFTAYGAAKDRLVNSVTSGYRLSSFDLHAIAEAEYTWELWLEVLHTTGTTGRKQEGAPLTIVGAVRSVVRAQTDDLVNDRYRGGSTSEFSNAIDASKRKAAADFIRSAMFITGRCDD